MALTTSSPVAEHSIIHNDAFYFDDDPMAVFLVENQLFKVHRYYFIQGSEFFRNLFTEAGGSGAASATDGRSDEQPIPLPHVTVVEFKTLLRFFYAMAERINNTVTGVDLLNLKIDEKLALLSISHRFMFQNIFKYIVRVIPLEEVDVLDRIRLGDKYDLSEWLFSAYENLLERTSERLTREEINTLGSDRVIRLLEAKVFLSQGRQMDPGCYNCNRRNSRSDTASRSIKEVAVRFFEGPDYLDLVMYL